jgi:hypothetical protein
MKLNRRIVFCSLTLAALATASLGLSAQSPSPLTGTWMINVAKSTYNPVSLAPRSSTSKVAITGDMIKVIVDGVDSMGRSHGNGANLLSRLLSSAGQSEGCRSTFGLAAAD